MIEKILENMFVGSPPGNYDRILDFSTPHPGALFYVPTADFLEDPPDAPPEPEPRAAATPAGTSLGIGSLRRSTRS